MKKKTYLISILSLTFVFVVIISGCANVSGTQPTPFFNDQDSEEVQQITENAFELGCVPDEETAREIGHSIFEALFEEGYDHGLPLVVQFNEEDECWYINSQLPSNMDGGCKYLILQKSDAKVVRIWSEQ